METAANKETLLSQKQLKTLLHYSPDSGVFTWKVKRSNGVKPGDLAGSKTVRGYARISINNIGYRAHRLAFLYMNGDFPKGQIDHINGVIDDNRWKNLRDVSQSLNQRNTKMNCRNKTGHCGVRFREGHNKPWIATWYDENKKGRQKSFFTFEEAVAYREEMIAQQGNYTSRHGK